MPLGTLDRTPPPFFRQGYSALTKVLFFSALAVFLMVADVRLQVVGPLRAAVATALHPVQMALKVPIELLSGGTGYLRGLQQALAAEAELRKRLTRQADVVARAEQLAGENAALRDLLGLSTALTVRSVAAEVMYEAGDPFSRKIFIDRGARQGVLAGAPVINEAGVIGQVTRVYPLSSEVTLLIDKDAAIPVLNTRTQQRGVAFGAADGSAMLELRFMAANADVQADDLMTTSGIDGVYPPGLAVARVSAVDRRSEGAFARVVMAPVAPIDGVRHVLVLEPLVAQRPPRPDGAASAPQPGAAAAASGGAAARDTRAP